MAAHEHDPRTYETTMVVGKTTHPETGAEIDQLATYTGCADCGKVLDDEHGVAPADE